MLFTSLAALALGARRAAAQCQEAKLAEGTPSFGFASWVRVDGATAVVSNPFGKSVYVYEFDGATWNLDLTLKSHASFGSALSVDVDGDWFVVGRQLEDPAGPSDSGRAFVYHREPAGWELSQVIVASDAKSADLFGCNVLLVGACGVDHLPAGPAHGGAGYVFELDPVLSTWNETHKLVPSAAGQGQKCGWGLARDGDTILLSGGGAGAGGGATVPGRLTILERVAGVWQEAGLLVHLEQPLRQPRPARGLQKLDGPGRRRPAGLRQR